MKKAPRETATPSSSAKSGGSIGLLDRREHPVAAAPAHEGPDLGGFGWLLAARDQPARIDVDIFVYHREAHRDAGIIGIALAPGFGEIALQQARVGDLVDLAAGAVLLHVVREERHHFGRRQRA